MGASSSSSPENECPCGCYDYWYIYKYLSAPPYGAIYDFIEDHKMKCDKCNTIFCEKEKCRNCNGPQFCHKCCDCKLREACEREQREEARRILEKKEREEAERVAREAREREEQTLENEIVIEERRSATDMERNVNDAFERTCPTVNFLPQEENTHVKFPQTQVPTNVDKFFP